MYSFSPFPILKTDRLLIRETTLDDVNEVHFLRYDEEVNRYIESSNYASNAADFINKVDASIKGGTTISWSIQFLDDPTMIGSICLWNFKKDLNSAEVGYALKPSFQNQRIMSEALKRTLEYGFHEMKLDMIEAFTHHENISSTRLLEKNGFKQNPKRTDEHNSTNLIYEIFSHNKEHELNK